MQIVLNTHMDCTYSCEFGRLEINQLLFTDDTALVADSEEKLCRLVSEFSRACERKDLKVNVGKSKVKVREWVRMHARLNGKPLEEVDCFKYM